MDSIGKIKAPVMPSLNATEGPHNTVAWGSTLDLDYNGVLAAFTFKDNGC